MKNPASKKNSSPLDMNHAQYEEWKRERDHDFIEDPDQVIVDITNPFQITAAEQNQINEILARNNFVIYQYDPKVDQPENAKKAAQQGKKGFESLCTQLGLKHSIPNPQSDKNNVTAIRDMSPSRSDNDQYDNSQYDKGQQKQSVNRYIPYSNKALGWHTDGYYNDLSTTVRTFLLHCETRADEGGENELIDPEMVYRLLRDQQPQLAQALTQSETLTIPANVENGRTIRTAFQGAVFSTDPISGRLYTRYTERKRNIFWNQDRDTLNAISEVSDILSKASKWKFNVTLQPGQGLLCNNVLHRRNGFSDSGENTRRFYRIRFSDSL